MYMRKFSDFFFASNEGVFDSVILWFAFEKICLKTLMRLVFVWVKESVCVCVAKIQD